MKGIILAGGKGTRLYPLTYTVNKHLLPIYDKPMIYYPLSLLMLAGIRDIAIVTTPKDKILFEQLLGDGSLYGIQLTYIVQPNPDGLAQAFILCEEFIGSDSVCLILGDNIFYGNGLIDIVKSAIDLSYGATIFAYSVKNPQDFGVVEFDDNFKAISITEKPAIPFSNYAIPGMYFYDNRVVEMSKTIKPSKRGELEISSLNEIYLKENSLNVLLLGRGIAWLDTGTCESLLEASKFVQIIEQRQGFKIACLEEISLNQGWIKPNDLLKYTEKHFSNNEYKDYILKSIERYI